MQAQTTKMKGLGNGNRVCEKGHTYKGKYRVSIRRQYPCVTDQLPGRVAFPLGEGRLR